MTELGEAGSWGCQWESCEVSPRLLHVNWHFPEGREPPSVRGFLSPVDVPGFQPCLEETVLQHLG